MMRGTWQTDGGGGQLVPALGALAAVGVTVWLIITFIWVIAAIVGVVLAAAVAGGVWLARHGGDVAMVAHAALPAPEVNGQPPGIVNGRPAQALPAPQQHVHYHLHLDGGQAAEVIRRQAITDRRTSS